MIKLLYLLTTFLSLIICCSNGTSATSVQDHKLSFPDLNSFHVRDTLKYQVIYSRTIMWPGLACTSNTKLLSVVVDSIDARKSKLFFNWISTEYQTLPYLSDTMIYDTIRHGFDSLIITNDPSTLFYLTGSFCDSIDIFYTFENIAIMCIDTSLLFPVDTIILIDSTNYHAVKTAYVKEPIYLKESNLLFKYDWSENTRLVSSSFHIQLVDWRHSTL